MLNECRYFIPSMPATCVDWFIFVTMYTFSFTRKGWHLWRKYQAHLQWRWAWKVKLLRSGSVLLWPTQDWDWRVYRNLSDVPGVCWWFSRVIPCHIQLTSSEYWILKKKNLCRLGTSTLHPKCGTDSRVGYQTITLGIATTLCSNSVRSSAGTSIIQNILHYYSFR